MILTQQHIDVKYSLKRNGHIRYNVSMREVVRLNVYYGMIKIIDITIIYLIQARISRKMNREANKLIWDAVVRTGINWN